MKSQEARGGLFMMSDGFGWSRASALHKGGVNGVRL
jgi:hypothetical protein